MPVRRCRDSVGALFCAASRGVPRSECRARSQISIILQLGQLVAFMHLLHTSWPAPAPTVMSQDSTGSR